MHIEKCQITTTETRTRTGWMKPDDVAIGIGPYYVWEAGVVGHDIPVTLTYPAPVQVEGVRVEMSREEAHVLLSILGTTTKVEGLPFYSGIKDVLGSGPFNDDAQPASPPTQASGESTIGDKLIAGLEGFRDKLKSGEPIEAVTYTTQPAPQDAGERVPYTMETWPKCDGARIRSGQDTSMLVTRVEHVGISSGVLHLTWHTLAADYELSTDSGATWQPCYQTKQPAPLPWRDLGPGLSVAVVEGKCVYVAQKFLSDYAGYFIRGDGQILEWEGRFHPTLAAAKAACDAHHAKGGA